MLVIFTYNLVSLVSPSVCILKSYLAVFQLSIVSVSRDKLHIIALSLHSASSLSFSILSVMALAPWLFK